MIFKNVIKASLAIVLFIGSSLPFAINAAPATDTQLAPAMEITNASVLGFPSVIVCSDSLGRINVSAGHFLVRVFGSYPGCDYAAGEIEKPDPNTDRMVVCSLFNVDIANEWEIVNIFGGGGQLTARCHWQPEYTIERVPIP